MTFEIYEVARCDVARCIVATHQFAKSHGVHGLLVGCCPPVLTHRCAHSFPAHNAHRKLIAVPHATATANNPEVELLRLVVLLIFILLLGNVCYGGRSHFDTDFQTTTMNIWVRVRPFSGRSGSDIGLMRAVGNTEHTCDIHSVTWEVCNRQPTSISGSHCIDFGGGCRGTGGVGTYFNNNGSTILSHNPVLVNFHIDVSTAFPGVRRHNCIDRSHRVTRNNITIALGTHLF